MLPAQANEPAAPEAPRRKFRKLRIAWSVAWGVVAVLLVALWAESYRTGPGKGYLPTPPNVVIRSTMGIVFIFKLPAPTPNLQPVQHETVFLSFHDPLAGKPIDFGPTDTWSGFLIDWRSKSFWYVQSPTWSLVGLSACFAVIPWITRRPRFSLRTLLIATTLVAVGLGVVVWLR